MRYFFSYMFICTMVSLLSVAYGQQVTLRVSDELSKDPVPFANVCIESFAGGMQKHYVTDLDGNVTFPVKEKSKLAISYIGYATFVDTILPGTKLQVSLKPTVLKMDEVVITAQYAPEKVDKSIYRVNVINAREIEQKGATNLQDLMKNQLNMRVSQSGVLGANLSLKGMSGQHIKFLVDGVPLIGRMDGNVDLNQINLNNVDHVEMIEGPMSVIYGSNALAGVINIISKENKAALYAAKAEAYSESVGVYNFNGGFSYNNKRHLFSIDAGRNFFGGYSPDDTTRSKLFKPRIQYFVNSYVQYTGKKFNAKVSGDYFNETLVYKGNLLPPYFENAFDSYFYTIRSTIKLEGGGQLGKGNMKILASYSTYDRIKKTYFKDLTTLEQVMTGNPEDQDTTGLRNWMARGVYTLNHAKYKYNVQIGFDLNSDQGSGKRITGKEQQIGDYAGFLTFKYDPISKLSIQPGVRYIYNTKYTAPLVYALTTRYNFSEKLSTRFSYSKGFRSPDIKELYLYFVDINHNVQGNPDLKAEKSDNFSLNLMYRSEKQKQSFTAEANLFYNRIRDNISLAMSPTKKDLYTYINIGLNESEGVNLDLSMSFYPKLSVKVGFAETGVLNTLETSTEKVSKFFWSPEVNSEVTYKPFKHDFSISAFYKYTGKMQQLIITNGEILNGYISAYHTMDMSLSQGFYKNRLRVSAGVKNLFDNKTIAAVGNGGGHGSGGGASNSLAIAWGRTAFLRLTYTFNKYN